MKGREKERVLRRNVHRRPTRNRGETDNIRGGEMARDQQKRGERRDMRGRERLEGGEGGAGASRE